jgi:hypothetical protein
MEATCSSEASVNFQRTTRCYIPEESILYNRRCENLKSYKMKYSFMLSIIFHKCCGFGAVKSEWSRQKYYVMPTTFSNSFIYLIK